MRPSPRKEEHMEDERKAPKYTEAKKRNNRKWDAANLDRLSVAAPKGTKAKWKAAAEARGQSLNQFIVDAVEAETESPAMAPERAVEGRVPPVGIPVYPGVENDAREAAITERAQKTAEEAAEATGETLPDFIERAVVIQAERDKLARKLDGKKKEAGE